MLNKLSNWIRTKFHKGYGQPKLSEIVQFLETNFELPNSTHAKNVKIHYLRPSELHNLIDEYFHFKTNKEINREAFKYLNYYTVKRFQFHHKSKWKAVPLILKTDIKIK